MAQIRLLQRNPDSSISFFQPLSSDDVPAYAILSHTWGREEITFQDMENGDMATTSSKDGWRKIDFCRRQATKDGLQYFWIDTCCIDRKNAVELSTAINSMFRWYQDAARCYVYLEDASLRPLEDGVPTVPAVSNDSYFLNRARAKRTRFTEFAESIRPWKEQFEESRWFTRGWTLQELIAPLNVKFYSTEGTFLGSKTSLELEIHRITGIPVRALGRSRLADFTKEERMKWASNRETTIEEDQVYCLLGILEVTLPLVYAEGKKSALSRLEEVIQKTTNSQQQSQYASSSQRTPHSVAGSSVSTQHSIYGRSTSPTWVQPVLRIPTHQMRRVVEALLDDQQEQIAESIFANCRLAAYQYCFDARYAILDRFRTSSQWAWLNSILGPSAQAAAIEANKLTLREWSFLLQQLQSESQLHRLYRSGSSRTGTEFAMPSLAMGILRLQDSWKKLNPLEFEKGLTYAITWCRHLYSADCEARLAWLWKELHPATVCALHLCTVDFSCAEVPSPLLNGDAGNDDLQARLNSLRR